MSLTVDVRHRLGRFALDAAFESTGRLTALFGPSGAGKSSLVNIVGGLIRPADGRVLVDGTTLIDTRRGVFLPPHRRRLGYIFQEGRLFPHLSVRQNLLYGRWFAPRGERHASLDSVIEMLGIGRLLDRRPDSLSGGEKQRVAIGRALLAAPRLLLMDEPLASLDAARKAEILPYIERLRDEAGIPIVYVSHSVSEVVRLATWVVVMADGKVAAAGPPRDLMSRLDLLALVGGPEAGVVIEASVSVHDDVDQLTRLASAAGELVVPRLLLERGTPVRVRIRARDVMLAREAPTGLSALNVLAARVAEIGAPDGAVVDVKLDCGGELLIARVTRRSVGRLGLAPGRPVFAVLKSIAFDMRTMSEAPRPRSADD
jgi:molybdate transport system ATP-binding protein